MALVLLGRLVPCMKTTLSFTDALQSLKTNNFKELATVLLFGQWQREVEKQGLSYLTFLQNHEMIIKGGSHCSVTCSKN